MALLIKLGRPREIKRDEMEQVGPFKPSIAEKSRLAVPPADIAWSRAKEALAFLANVALASRDTGHCWASKALPVLGLLRKEHDILPTLSLYHLTLSMPFIPLAADPSWSLKALPVLGPSWALKALPILHYLLVGKAATQLQPLQPSYKALLEALQKQGLGTQVAKYSLKAKKQPPAQLPAQKALGSTACQALSSGRKAELAVGFTKDAAIRSIGALLKLYELKQYRDGTAVVVIILHDLTEGSKDAPWAKVICKGTFADRAMEALAQIPSKPHSSQEPVLFAVSHLISLELNAYKITDNSEMQAKQVCNKYMFDMRKAAQKQYNQLKANKERRATDFQNCARQADQEIWVPRPMGVPSPTPDQHAAPGLGPPSAPAGMWTQVERELGDRGRLGVKGPSSQRNHAALSSRSNAPRNQNPQQRAPINEQRPGAPAHPAGHLLAAEVPRNQNRPRAASMQQARPVATLNPASCSQAPTVQLPPGSYQLNPASYSQAPTVQLPPGSYQASFTASLAPSCGPPNNGPRDSNEEEEEGLDSQVDRVPESVPDEDFPPLPPVI
eukprot:gene12531-15747_t